MIDEPVQSATAPERRRRWRFAAVLAASLFLAVVQPLLAGWFGERTSFDVFFSLLIAAVLLLAFEEKEHRRTAVAFGLAAMIGVWLSRGFDGRLGLSILIAAHVAAVCFFGLILVRILRSVLVVHVSADSIFGAVCGYLLLGIIWTLLYSAVETAFPGSFRLPAADPSGETVAGPDRGVLGYYSFVTLTTVGYGDVTPATPLARTLAWMEAIAGQFYLAVLVAGLMGFVVSQAMHKPR